MRLLLDTQIFLWAVMGSAKLKAEARKTMRDADEIYVSSASIWEIAIKIGLGKLNADPKLIVAAIGESGFMELPVYSRHVVMVSELPQIGIKIPKVFVDKLVQDFDKFGKR